MKKTLILLVALSLSSLVSSLSSLDAQTKRMYDDGQMRIFLPNKCCGKAILALPGGGYSKVALQHEGYDWAEYFNAQGIVYVVLNYRLPNGDKTIPINDAKNALAYIRSHAAEWGVKTNKVGIMGSSAGGHLASTIATHSDSKTAPNFQILFYPVISMEKGKTHMGSRDNFLGKNPSQTDINLYSNEKQVKRSTPPAIIILAQDDKGVPPDNGFKYALNMTDKGASALLLTYPTGGHGFGFRPSFKYHDDMLSNLKMWLSTL